jgi:hypothetical protein
VAWPVASCCAAVVAVACVDSSELIAFVSTPPKLPLAGVVPAVPAVPAVAPTCAPLPRPPTDPTLHSLGPSGPIAPEIAGIT